jgi:hypothetical protein
MPQMIAALFKEQAQAQQSLQALIEMGIARDRITATGSSDAREISSISGFRSLSARDDSPAALHDLDLPEADLRLFEQGLQRGHTLIAARVDRTDLDKAIRVLEMFDPVDLDRDSREWTQSAGSAESGADHGAPLGAGIVAGSTEGQTNTSALPGMGAMTGAMDDLGTADQRTDEPPQSDMGLGSTTATGGRREDERAGREGVNELATEPAMRSSAPAARTGPFQREMNRGGRVWAYGAVEDGSL